MHIAHNDKYFNKVLSNIQYGGYCINENDTVACLTISHRWITSSLLIATMMLPR